MANARELDYQKHLRLTVETRPRMAGKRRRQRCALGNNRYRMRRTICVLTESALIVGQPWEFELRRYLVWGSRGFFGWPRIQEIRAHQRCMRQWTAGVAQLR